MIVSSLGTASHSHSLCAGRLNCYRAGKQDGIRNDNSPAVSSAQDRRASLDVVDRSFDARNTDEVSELKRFLQNEQNPCEKVLKDILKGKTNGHRADSKQFDQIAGFERWRTTESAIRKPRVRMLV